MPYKDPAKKRAADRRWREANKDKVRAQEKARALRRDKAKHRELQRQWYQKNKERISAELKAYREANQAKVKEWREAYKSTQRLKDYQYKYGELAEAAMITADLWKAINTSPRYRDSKIIKNRQKDARSRRKAREREKLIKQLSLQKEGEPNGKSSSTNNK